MPGPAEILNAPLQGPPPLEPAERDRREELVGQAVREIETGRERLKRENLETPNGLLSALRYCGAYDRALKSLCQWASRVAEGSGVKGESMALVAQGGYGRRQLCLHSDIDLLFLLPATSQDRAKYELRLILYALYEAKVDLGHGARTIDQALECVGQDLNSTTALVERRWLAGSRALFESLRSRMDKRIRRDYRRWFFEALFADREARHKKHGASVFTLEPNIKEGEGGLRDLHVAAWLAYVLYGDARLRVLEQKEIWTPAQLRDARNGRAFLLRLRNELHRIEGRRVEQLRLHRQHEIADLFGYVRTEEFLAEEVFLRDYYMYATTVHSLTDGAVNEMRRTVRGVFDGVVRRLRRRRIDETLMATGDVAFLDDNFTDWFRRDPRHILETAAVAAENGLKLSEVTKERMRRARSKIGESFLTDPRNRDNFQRILRSPTHVASTLRALHESGVLAAYFPEWEHLFCLVRSDGYHAYTVDEHHFKCLEAAERIRAQSPDADPRTKRAAGAVKRWDILFFALLLHDVGKGLGGAHALRGAQIADRIASRMGLPEADRDMARFLVRSHLKMSHVAHRRDLLDDRVIEDFAREVEDVVRLRLLYLHTVSDLQGVSPNAYNDWIAQLLALLYERAENRLEGRPPEAQHPRSVLPELRQSVSAIVPAEARVGVEDFLEALPDRYLAVATAERAAEHYLLARELNDENRVAWKLHDRPNVNYSELLVSTTDEPGGFARTCGALASKDINILSAEIHSTTNGFAVNRFLVTDSSYNRLPEGFRLDRLRKDLNEAFLGRLDIAEMIARSRSVRRPTQQRLDHRPARVEIDNEASNSHTVIEVHAHDRTGLLYDVAHAMFRSGLSIDLALISTQAYHVVDVFYVTDVEGNKFYGQAERDSLRNALLKAISFEPGPS